MCVNFGDYICKQTGNFKTYNLADSDVEGQTWNWNSSCDHSQGQGQCDLSFQAKEVLKIRVKHALNSLKTKINLHFILGFSF